MPCECQEPTKFGYAYKEWIYKGFQDCVYTPLDVTAWFIGMSSLCFWICCQAPQFVKNWKRGSAEALSLWFLLEWLGGDTLNMVGCILTRQLPTQTYTAILFVVMDVIMMSQYTFLHFKNKRRTKREERLGLLRHPKGKRNNSFESDSDSDLDDDPQLSARVFVEPNLPAALLPASELPSGSTNPNLTLNPHATNNSQGQTARNQQLEVPLLAHKQLAASDVVSSQSSSRGGSFSSRMGTTIALAVSLALYAGSMPAMTSYSNSTPTAVTPLQHAPRTLRAGPLQYNNATISQLGFFRRPPFQHSGLHYGHPLQQTTISASDMDIPSTLTSRQLKLDPCIPVNPPKKAAVTVGNVLGWISSVLYLNSRLPQVYRNFKRQSVDGLSWLMFFCAFMGNFTTVTSVVMRILNDWKADQHEDWVGESPFLPGSAGTLMFDFIIIMQYVTYTKRAKIRRAERARLRAELRAKHVLDKNPEVQQMLQDTPAIPSYAVRGVHDIVEYVPGEHSRGEHPRDTLAIRLEEDLLRGGDGSVVNSEAGDLFTSSAGVVSVPDESIGSASPAIANLKRGRGATE